jgi:hypothetical protein
MLIGGVAGGVLLTPGTAFAGPVTAVGTTTSITGTSVSPGSSGATINVQVSVTPASGTVWPAGTVKVSDGAGGGCVVSLSESGSTAVGVGGCSIYGVGGGSYGVTATYEGSSAFTWSASGATTVWVKGSAPVFTADSPSLSATAGGSYGYQFYATNNASYKLSGAPGWLNINSGTGAVWGTVPNWVTSFSYSVIAWNSSGSATAGPYTVWVRHPRPHTQLSSYLSCTSRVYAAHEGTCTLSVTNTGYSSASNVNAQINLPWQLKALHCGSFTWWNYGCSISYNTASENLGTLYPGQTKSLTVVFVAKFGWNLWFGGRPHVAIVKVTGSASSGYATTYSAAWVKIVPRGWWWAF